MFGVRTLELVKESIMLSTSHCEMALMMIRMSKYSDRYVPAAHAEYFC